MYNFLQPNMDQPGTSPVIYTQGIFLFSDILYTRHTSLLQMKTSFLSILCTAYCNTIMPQSEYTVDNICTTVIMKSSNNMHEWFFKKTKRLRTVPVSCV